MNKIKLLDCTLRDGGYVVDTIFGDFAIQGISKKLMDTKVDIIELGYVKNCVRKEGSTTFSCLEELIPLLPAHKIPQTEYAVMIEHNTLDLNKLISAQQSGIDIVRICFFKNQRFEVMDYAKKIIDKGYKVFLQPMDTLGYSDRELLELIEKSNQLKPAAFYIVDSYGSMYPQDLRRIYSLLNHNLGKETYIGLHSHNNLQLSFTLVQNLVELSLNERNIIVDASASGIGRGAGNANTELVIDYLNRKMNCNYDMNSMLDLLDTFILKIQQEHSWGYNIPHFISGMYSVHVNNISYLLNKHNLKAKDMRIIVESIDKTSEKRYDYEKLENSLVSYFSKEVDDSQTLEKLQSVFSNKNILLIAPGASVSRNIGKIQTYISENKPVVICINAIINQITPDFLFYSNIIRYEYSKEKYPEEFNKAEKILTSNIKTSAGCKENIVNYNLLLKRGWKYFDNSTIMCLRLLSKLDAENIAIAGFDGYKTDNNTENYVDNNILVNLTNEDKKLLNDELSDMLSDFINNHKNIAINFLTKTNLKLK